MIGYSLRVNAWSQLDKDMAACPFGLSWVAADLLLLKLQQLMPGTFWSAYSDLQELLIYISIKDF